ncbi:MAG: TRCF domain-containing protein [Dehalococcoidia bacterium]
MRDLEIRGAGNLLGAEQSGHISAVGFELYNEMLSAAVQRMRALQQGATPPPPPPPPITVELPLTAHLPEPYIADLNLRLSVYWQLSHAASAATVDEVAVELAVFGPPPPVVEEPVMVGAVPSGARRRPAIAHDRGRRDRATSAGGHRPPRRARDVNPDLVQVGTAQIRIEARTGWREALEATLARLQPDWSRPGRRQRTTAPSPRTWPGRRAPSGRRGAERYAGGRGLALFRPAKPWHRGFPECRSRRSPAAVAVHNVQATCLEAVMNFFSPILARARTSDSAG